MSSAKNLSGMFDDAKFFNQPLDKWDTSNVENMGGMFAEAISFNQDLSMWDVRKVNNMTNMFRNAVKFYQDLSNWDIPLIQEAPLDFSTKSPVISPEWNRRKSMGLNWNLLLLLSLLIPLLLILVKLKKKKSISKTEPQVYEVLRIYLNRKNTNQISKTELDEILGITNKSFESQKKIRANFINQFNASGFGEINRTRDDFDSRSFNYDVKWNNRSNK